MRNKGRLIVFGAILLAFAFALGACGSKRSRRSAQTATVLPSGAAVAATRSLSPLPRRPLSPKLQAIREQLMRETATLRGLDWAGEVGMTELSGWEYGTRTKEVADVLGGDDLKALSKLAIAGGILPEGTDLATLAVSFTAASAGATYSPFDKQVLLLQREPAQADVTANKSLLAHELTHALQDEHFNLLNLLLARPYNFDRTEAAFALVEGDAMNVQRRREQGDAWARRTLEDIARQEDERFGDYRKGIGAFFPPLLTETFIFRYRDGARFVETVRRARPPVSLDEVFRHPPVSSEQVLHAEKYFAGEAPREASVDEQGFADAGWRMAAATPLGEIGVRGLLMAGVTRAEATRAAAGWGGDRACVFEQEGHAPLFVWQTVWDKREDAQEFYRSYNALRRRGSVEVKDSEAGDALEPGGESYVVWQNDNLLTLVRLAGDHVLVLRGTRADLAAALKLTRA